MRAWGATPSNDDGDLERNHRFHVVDRVTKRRVMTFFARSYHGFFEHEGDEWGPRRVEIDADDRHVLVHERDGGVRREPIPD